MANQYNTFQNCSKSFNAITTSEVYKVSTRA